MVIVLLNVKAVFVLFLQNVVSQAQTMPPMSQAGPTNGMAYMGYQPYSMQNMISALPGQDPNMPPQQAYMPGQQPMYQQVCILELFDMFFCAA